MKALLRQLQNNGDSLNILVFGDNRFTAIGEGKPEEDFADFLENNSGAKKACEVLEASYIKKECTSTDVRVVEFEPQVKFLRKPETHEAMGFMLSQASQEDVIKALATTPTDYEGEPMRALLTVLTLGAHTLTTLEFAGGDQIAIGASGDAEADFADFQKENAKAQGHWEVDNREDMSKDVEVQVIREVDIDNHDNYLRAYHEIEALMAQANGVTQEDFLADKKVTLREYPAGSATIH